MPLDHVTFSPENIDNLLSGADVVLHQGSGAAFKALAAGIPSINVARMLDLSYDKMPAGLSPQARDEDELADYLVDLPSLPADALERLAEFVAPVDERILVDLVMGSDPVVSRHDG